MSINFATLGTVAKNDLIVADYNAIEARGTAWLAGAKALLSVFQRDEDPYLYQACHIYQVPQGTFTKKDAVQRQLGKKCSPAAIRWAGRISRASAAWRRHRSS